MMHIQGRFEISISSAQKTLGTTGNENKTLPCSYINFARSWPAKCRETTIHCGLNSTIGESHTEVYYFKACYLECIMKSISLMTLRGGLEVMKSQLSLLQWTAMCCITNNK